MRRGGSLYEGGPKRKGPLRLIIEFTSHANGLFDHSTGWLECGHFCNRIFGNEKAICQKCRDGKPKDEVGPDGWPKGAL